MSTQIHELEKRIKLLEERIEELENKDKQFDERVKDTVNEHFNKGGGVYG